MDRGKNKVEWNGKLEIGKEVYGSDLLQDLTGESLPALGSEQRRP